MLVDDYELEIYPPHRPVRRDSCDVPACYRKNEHIPSPHKGTVLTKADAFGKVLGCGEHIHDAAGGPLTENGLSAFGDGSFDNGDKQRSRNGARYL